VTSALSGVVYGGTPSETMRNAVALNPKLVSSPTNAARADRFWSSSPAFISSEIKEVLEINYASAGLTNVVAFDAVLYPQIITIEYTESNTGAWLPVLDARTNAPLEVEVLRSYPPVLPDPSTVRDTSIPSTTTTVTGSASPSRSLLFTCRSSASSSSGTQQGPDRSTSSVRQSPTLSLSRTSTPTTSSPARPMSPTLCPEVDSDTSSQVFASTADLFGSNLGFSEKVNSAANLIFNSDESAPLIWKSEPQPIPGAVVNFYADLRDSRGRAQTIDQIFIDPLYLGSRVNLYYSNDLTSTGNFESSRSALTPNRAALNQVTASSSNLDFGADQTSYIVFDNTYLDFDPAQDWWLGIDWQPVIGSSPTGTLFSCETFQILIGEVKSN
jgi:hypothetical protein